MRLAGYTYLIEELGLAMPALGLELGIGNKSSDEILPYGFTRIKVLAKSRKVEDSVFGNLEAAINYQGIRLAYLKPIFEKILKDELTQYIALKPQAVQRRCIWFLYEWLTGNKLDLPNSKSNYAPLLDEEYYFCCKEGVKDARTRIINNTLGNINFCPMIRKTPEIIELQYKDLMAEAQQKLMLIHKYVNPELLGRSVQYLYTKETKSSTEIEKESTDEDKMRKFHRVLKTAGTIPLSKRRLLDIQHEIVRSNKKDEDYRADEIYVGETRPSWHDGVEENIHYIGPKSEHVPKLMQGLFEMHRALLLDNTLPSMMHAAILSFGFVYIHPFSDGNGRIHRYLIHDVLKSRRTISQDFIIPVSATILLNNAKYDRVLEKLSKPVMALIDYDLDEKDHSITINNDINFMYQYPDLTDHVVFLYEMMKTSISQDLMQEVIYIVKYDAVKKEIEKRYDIPNKELNLLIALVLQNNGTLSIRKRKRFYGWIAEAGLKELERVILDVLEGINANTQGQEVSNVDG